ncbi:hypothetical protein DFJ58DRAFT_843327 [Suillus subalutaceus]|uniref:uncharacterized protein n=1 Tax=Suillus subalutaceus TaxID=48586 RepID=UPI001B870222|nr:uncharacterized protein DFJ58DRAFT_843327 [Suillus subalutaceus]KAG1847010.1 hypothetical protein DFJ58DRAFT_843327 [Suillus subalutaceus]
MFKLEAPENTYSSDPEVTASHKLEEEFRPADDDGEDDDADYGRGTSSTRPRPSLPLAMLATHRYTVEDVTPLQRLRAQQYHKLKIPFNDWIQTGFLTRIKITQIQPLEKRRSQWRPKSTRGHALSIESIGTAVAAKGVFFQKALGVGHQCFDREDERAKSLIACAGVQPQLAWPALYLTRYSRQANTPNITPPYISQISKARGFFNIFGDGNCIAAFKIFEFEHGNFVVPFVFKLRRNSWSSMPKLRLQYGVPHHVLGAIATPLIAFTPCIQMQPLPQVPPLHLPNQYDADDILNTAAALPSRASKRLQQSRHIPPAEPNTICI